MGFKIYPPSKINILDEIISDIQNDLVSEFLFWSPIEHYFPGDGDFNDSGKSFNELLKLINEKNVNFFALFGSPSEQSFYDKDRRNNIKILGWPTSLLHYTEHYIKNNESSNDFDKLFVCLNNRSHTHRSKLIDSLFKNGLFEFGKISWRQVDRILNSHVFEYWKETKLEIEGDNDDFYFDSKCFLNLVSESISERLFISEKTFKPILGEQAFLCYGFLNQNKHLKNYGFELYDEIFDYEFDSYPLIEDRINGIIKNLDNLKTQDLKDLYGLVKEKIKHNKNNAISILKNDEYISSEMYNIFYKHKDVFFQFRNKNKDIMMDIIIDSIIKKNRS
jgi:hypothetical protein